MLPATKLKDKTTLGRGQIPSDSNKAGSDPGKSGQRGDLAYE